MITKYFRDVKIEGGGGIPEESRLIVKANGDLFAYIDYEAEALQLAWFLRSTIPGGTLDLLFDAIDKLNAAQHRATAERQSEAWDNGNDIGPVTEIDGVEL